MSVVERLKEWIAATGTNVNQVTVKCSFTPGALNKMISRNNGLHSDTISALLRHYPDLDADWLLLGLGKMKRAEPRCSDVAKRPYEAPVTREEFNALEARTQEILARLEAAQKGEAPRHRRKAG